MFYFTISSYDCTFLTANKLNVSSFLPRSFYFPLGSVVCLVQASFPIRFMSDELDISCNLVKQEVQNVHQVLDCLHIKPFEHKSRLYSQKHYTYQTDRKWHPLNSPVVHEVKIQVKDGAGHLIDFESGEFYFTFCIHDGPILHHH
jgi:hypothetical protein